MICNHDARSEPIRHGPRLSRTGAQDTPRIQGLKKPSAITVVDMSLRKWITGCLACHETKFNTHVCKSTRVKKWFLFWNSENLETFQKFRVLTVTRVVGRAVPASVGHWHALSVKYCNLVWTNAHLQSCLWPWFSWVTLSFKTCCLAGARYTVSKVPKTHPPYNLFRAATGQRSQTEFESMETDIGNFECAFCHRVSR